MNRSGDEAEFVRPDDGFELEPEMREALSNFKSSVDAWSESAMSLPREIKTSSRAHRGIVTKWALGCAVFLATVSGGVYEHHRQIEAARAEAARLAEQQHQLAAERAKAEADLMAKVDSDIAREVPSALEPLASLMDSNQTSGN